MAQPAKGSAHTPCSTPPTAPTLHTGFPARAQTVLGSGISAGALAAVLPNLFFHHLGTRSGGPAPALKSS